MNGIFAVKYINKNTFIGEFFTIKKYNFLIDFNNINSFYKPKFFENHNLYFERNIYERYINHSNDPNCYCLFKNNNILLYTAKNIFPANELTLNYNLALQEINKLEESLF